MIVSCELLPCVLHDRLILQLPRDPASQLYRLKRRTAGYHPRLQSPGDRGPGSKTAPAPYGL